jgi:hypothetical protein
MHEKKNIYIYMCTMKRVLIQFLSFNRNMFKFQGHGNEIQRKIYYTFKVF